PTPAPTPAPTPPPEPAPAPKPEPQKAVEPPPTPAQKPTPPKPQVAEKKPEPPKEQPKKPEPPKEQVKKEPENRLASLLSSVNKLKEQQRTEDQKPQRQQPQQQAPQSPQQQRQSPQTSRLNDPTRDLSMSEMDAVRQQIAQCWNVPAGARDAQELIVDIFVVMNPDATVREARIVNSGRGSSDPFYRSASESALRAVLNPRCSPLKLPRDKFDTWKTMTLSFNPKDMLAP
ncbi:MAG: energy transducer TonB, partial [Alphaproteobacteria bacterium]|nr:energy transducer TonB [Alphaproteobacteria bacterium]